MEDNQWLVDLFKAAESNPVYVEQPKPVYPKNTQCPRCAGSGRLSYYSHVKAGECFKCHGRGFIAARAAITS